MSPPEIASAPAALSILYLGANSSTSMQRARALERLGHEVAIVDPRALIPNSRALNSWIHHTGALAVNRLVEERLVKKVATSYFDLVWVDIGTLLNPSLVQKLKQRFQTVINYNIDDPFGGRDGLRFRQYLRSLHLYDLVVVVRECNVEEARRAGAAKVLKVFRGADEVAHAPRELSLEDVSRWESEVSFIGTWMPERGPFLARLIELGIPLSIHGNRWDRAPEWRMLRPYWRGPGIHKDDDYAKAVQCAKVCLGLLSKDNRDLSTTRSFEIPHLGGTLCAERTAEHSALYREDIEAVFWSSPEECAEKCARLLADDEWRRRLRLNGRKRCLMNRTTNEAMAQLVLAQALSLADRPALSPNK